MADPGDRVRRNAQMPLPFASPMTAELTPKQRQEVVALLAQLLLEAIEHKETNDDR